VRSRECHHRGRSCRNHRTLPIPGTGHLDRREEIAAAAGLAPSASTLHALDEIFRLAAAAGPRYPEASARTLEI
jgi:hypothetical protein